MELEVFAGRKNNTPLPPCSKTLPICTHAWIQDQADRGRDIVIINQAVYDLTSFKVGRPAVQTRFARLPYAPPTHHTIFFSHSLVL